MIMGDDDVAYLERSMFNLLALFKKNFRIAERIKKEVIADKERFPHLRMNLSTLKHRSL
jgi:hypothetical protein